jgi:predicted amidohydrolase
LQYVSEYLDEAGRNGAKLSVLGETFNCIYSKEHCTRAAENFSLESSNPLSTPTISLLKEMAKKH